MAAPKGNRFWEARSTHGRAPIFETAEQLADACDQYFNWVADNPLIEVKPFAYQGEVTMADMPKMRAMTLGALCLYIGISFETWCEWRKTRNDFSEVMRNVEQAIRQQKFEGAAADLLNANIIARDLGLADKTEIKAEVETKDMTDREVARRLAFLLAAGLQGDQE